MIRRAEVADVDAIVEMGQAFLNGTPYKNYLANDPTQMRAVVDMLMGAVDGLVLVAEQGGRLCGMIGMLIFPHFLSGERVAGELFWWVAPDARGSLGIRLLRQAEAWAQSKAVAHVQMIAPDPRVGLIYERLGYHQIETAYFRRLA